MSAPLYLQAMKRLWLIPSTLAVVGAAGLGANASLAEQEFVAEARVQLTFVAPQERPEPDSPAGPGGTSGASPGPQTGPTLPPEAPERAEARRVSTITQMVASDNLAMAVISELGLGYDPATFKRKTIAITTFGTRQIVINVTDSDPRQAAAIADAVARQLQQAADESPSAVGQADLMGQVEAASVPVSPKPSRWQIPAVAGLLAGFALGLGIACLIVRPRSATTQRD